MQRDGHLGAAAAHAAGGGRTSWHPAAGIASRQAAASKEKSIGAWQVRMDGHSGAAAHAAGQGPDAGQACVHTGRGLANQQKSIDAEAGEHKGRWWPDARVQTLKLEYSTQ